MARAPYALKDYLDRFAMHVKVRGAEDDGWRFDHLADDYVYTPPAEERTIEFHGGAHPLWIDFDITPATAREFAAVLLRLAADCDGAASAVPGIDPLQLLQPTLRDDCDVMEWQGLNGTDRMYQRRFCPDGWAGRVAWHPSHWRIYRSRTDARGVDWSTSSEPHVMDDFGDLVEVPV